MRGRCSCLLPKQRTLSLCRVQMRISEGFPTVLLSEVSPLTSCPFDHGHLKSLWPMTTGLCSVNDPPSRYELAGTEPCRDATWSDVPETINLSSFPSVVAAVITDLPWYLAVLGVRPQ